MYDFTTLPEPDASLDDVQPLLHDAIFGLEDLTSTAGSLSDGLILDLPGRCLLLDAATVDSDGDGVEDSVALADRRGVSILTDSTGDGLVDRVTSVGFDGSFTTWERAGDGDSDSDMSIRDGDVGHAEAGGDAAPVSTQNPEQPTPEIGDEAVMAAKQTGAGVSWSVGLWRQVTAGELGTNSQP